MIKLTFLITKSNVQNFKCQAIHYKMRWGGGALNASQL